MDGEPRNRPGLLIQGVASAGMPPALKRSTEQDRNAIEEITPMKLNREEKFILWALVGITVVNSLIYVLFKIFVEK